MAFRADDATRLGREEVEAYLIPKPRDLDAAERARSKEALLDIMDDLGPVVDAYPTWHPLVCNHEARETVTTPEKRCGYEGLDHTRHFAKGFITCPYDDGQDVIDSVEKLPYNELAEITAERLDVTLYYPGTTAILVKCNWKRPLENDGTIPLRIAMPLILEKEVPNWRQAEVGETWETMRPYFLGRPTGSVSSLFINQATGQAIKKVWNAVIYTGMFGPIMV